MNKKVVGGLFAVLFVTSIVQTSAILKIQKTNEPSHQLASVVSLDLNKTVSSQEEILTFEDYFKQKYPRDYQKKTNFLKLKIQNHLETTLGSDDPEELRRFLCWLTGGVWVQIGPNKSCIYADVTVGFVEDGTITSIENYERIIQEGEDLYFKTNHNFTDSKEMYENLELVFSNTEVEVESLGPWFRRLLCRLFGGDWLEGQEISNGVLSGTFSSCTY
jgi:hypothetical protein